MQDEKTNEIQDNNKYMVEKDILERAKKKILKDIDKSIKWHMKNLLDLNLAFPYEELKYILISERKKKYILMIINFCLIWIIFLLI